MATPEAHVHDAPHDDPAGTFRLNPEEEEELVEAMREAEEEAKAGELRAVREMIERMRRELRAVW